jgi:O6-methylguanine-DNA--protein-cysteine methyltransferase
VTGTVGVETPLGRFAVTLRDGRVSALRWGRAGKGAGSAAARRWLSLWIAGREPEVPLDLSNVPDFHRRVYEIVRRIPPGRTMTYGEVARAAGRPGAARAVGNAMGRNPIALFIP